MRLTILPVAILTFALAACGGATPKATSASGLDPSLLARDLTDAQLRALCDWSADISGGYGHVTTCDAGITVRGKVDQQACVASVNQSASCTATVHDVETCTQRQAANPCDFAATFLTPECVAVRTCG